MGREKKDDGEMIKIEERKMLARPHHLCCKRTVPTLGSLLSKEPTLRGFS